MAVHPVDYLVLPRFIAMLISMPLLVAESVGLGIVEGRLDLVGHQQLLRGLQVLLGDEDVHIAHRIDAVDVAPQVGDDAFGAQTGGDHPRVEG